MGIFLYALELEGGHYYVGQSFEPDERLAVHKAGKGSAWTRLHPLVRELERRATRATDWKVAEVAENEWTLELMALYGWEKVRGGFWCHTCPIQTRKGLLAHGCVQLVEAGQLCSAPGGTLPNVAHAIALRKSP